MALITAIKRWIKSHPTGLYVTEVYKKRKYEALSRRLSDREFIEREYRRRNHGLPLQLDDPQTFSQKLQWLKLHHRDEMMSVCADKLALKGYLSAQGLADYAVPTLAVYDDVKAVDLDALPDRFVLKATHGSGWNWICRDRKADWASMRRVFSVWMSESLYLFGRERHYRDVPPRLMAEPLLFEEPSIEYKFMCFDGAARAVQVNHTVDGQSCVDIYDIDWNKLEHAAVGELPHSERELPRPAPYEEMRDVAQTLAKSFSFVRVDMYLVDNKIYVGEMTFFTGGGFFPITPLVYDRLFGEWLKLPEQMAE